MSKARVISTGWSSFSAGGGRETQEYSLPCLYNRIFYCTSDFHDKFYTQTQETLRLEKRYVEGESEPQTLNTPTGESAERANTKHTYSAAVSVMLTSLICRCHLLANCQEWSVILLQALTLWPNANWQTEQNADKIHFSWTVVIPVVIKCGDEVFVQWTSVYCEICLVTFNWVFMYMVTFSYYSVLMLIFQCIFCRFHV